MGYCCPDCIRAGYHPEYGACGHFRESRVTDAAIRCPACRFPYHWETTSPGVCDGCGYSARVTAEELEHLRPVSTFNGEQPTHRPGQLALPTL